jgi:dTDP-4-amino-4,6-dideoxygalactose transaminase
MLSGSYMLYGKHRAGPPSEAYEAVRLVTPNISGRMDNLRAAILRPQLRQLEAQCTAWNDRYRVVDQGLAEVAGLTRIKRPQQEKFVASSYQFLLLDWPAEAIRSVLARCLARGVELKWFGAPDPVGFTSRYDSWTYAPSSSMPKSDRILHGIIDMRLPLTFSLDDCATVARIIAQEVAEEALAG